MISVLKNEMRMESTFLGGNGNQMNIAWRGGGLLAWSIKVSRN